MPLKHPEPRANEQIRVRSSAAGETGPRFATWSPERKQFDWRASERHKRYLKVARSVLILIVVCVLIRTVLRMLHLPVEIKWWIVLEMAVWSGVFGVKRALEDVRKLPDDYWQGRPWDRFYDWPVEIDVVQSGVRTGSDSGMLWVDRGTIYYVGKRTSFALGREQLASVLPVRHQPFPLRPLQRLIEIRLAPVHGLTDWCLEIDPISRAISERLATTLEEAVRSPNAFIEGQFPPVVLGPRPHRRLDFFAGLVTAPFRVPFVTWFFTILAAGWIWVRWSSDWTWFDFAVTLALATGWLFGSVERIRLPRTAWRRSRRVLQMASMRVTRTDCGRMTFLR